MRTDYDLIREENIRKYGTDIGRIGRMLLADRYDDRTHFIFELMQNAEDALARRGAWRGSRSVNFKLYKDRLVLTHYGKPFDQADVRGICGIAESTKSQHSIGRFGIGFKSVYTFTDRPEVHSGAEEFAIENYVYPVATPSRGRDEEETAIVLPLREDDKTAIADLTEGFRRLGPNVLLFLKQIEEISWSVDGGTSGLYLRSAPEDLSETVQRITLIGQEGDTEIDQRWLVFRRELSRPGSTSRETVELAFSLAENKGSARTWSIQAIPSSPLVVFFPTVVQTHLGFLVQGPFVTTPSRDNVPRQDTWNQFLTAQAADLLVEAMRWLRDQNDLDVAGLQCLPLHADLFPEQDLFHPFYSRVREVLAGEPLLPKYPGGYVEARQAKIARTQDLRDLVSSEQLSSLFQSSGCSWISADVTADRAPELRQYLMRELEVAEVTPGTFIQKLTKEFLELQSNEWICRLYEFLSGQEALLRQLLDIPIIRVRSGQHVLPIADKRANAFLPSEVQTSFPTVRPEVCGTQAAMKFLKSLGITEPDPVDDVLWNVLPKYDADEITLNDDEYEEDIARIIQAFDTDSKAQREKLIEKLRASTFVLTVSAESGEELYARPGEAYISTERLRQLFDGVPDVLLVSERPALRGEKLREVLEACGAVRYPRPIEHDNSLNYLELLELREKAGHAATSGRSDYVQDWKLQGLGELLDILPTLKPEERARRARLLWESLGELEERRGRGLFRGTYTWTHHGNYRSEFPAAFVRALNTSAWVPARNGQLARPYEVIFDDLGWRTHPFLQSVIAFKPPIIEQLAKEIGIEPAALDLLKKLGITSVADLTSRLGVSEMNSTSIAQIESDDSSDDSLEERPVTTIPIGFQGPDDVAEDVTGGEDVYAEAQDLYDHDMPSPGISGKALEDRDASHSLSRGQAASRGSRERVSNIDSGQTSEQSSSTREDSSDHSGSSSVGKNTGNAGERSFVSYVSVHSAEFSDDEAVDQAARMQLEEKAISFILELEPALQRTEVGNPGFDLYQNDQAGRITSLVEVKAMTTSLEHRPVGLSHTQFECAQKHGDEYWLYVVEFAGEPLKRRVLRIRNPAGNARTFTFDKGWAQFAVNED